MPDLAEIPNEIFAIERTDGLEGVRLAPDARRRELLAALRERYFDVLWLATHGGDDGIWLHEGDVLAAGDLVGMVRSAGLYGVVVNSCASETLAQLLHDETGVDVVCSVQEVGDASAFQLGALFARELGACGDFREAFDRTRPGGVDAIFRYVPGYRNSLVIMAPERNTFSGEELRTIYEALNDIRQRLAVVEVEVRFIRTEMDGRRGDLRAPAQWVIVVVGLLMSLGLFALLYFVVGQLAWRQ